MNTVQSFVKMVAMLSYLGALIFCHALFRHPTQYSALHLMWLWLSAVVLVAATYGWPEKWR